MRPWLRVGMVGLVIALVAPLLPYPGAQTAHAAAPELHSSHTIPTDSSPFVLDTRVTGAGFADSASYVLDTRTVGAGFADSSSFVLDTRIAGTGFGDSGAFTLDTRSNELWLVQ